MWRFCDLHNHTFPNESCDSEWDPEEFIDSCLSAGIEVAAITDHDRIPPFSELMEASEGRIELIPGVEISTDRGHILVLAPGPEGLGIVSEFTARVGARPDHQVDVSRFFEALGEPSSQGDAFSALMVSIGAHVDMDGSLLASPNTLSIERQLAYAEKLDALEVTRDEAFEEWRTSGVKQGSHQTLLRGSDTHNPRERRSIGTWLYLPEITTASLKHALALREASVAYEGPMGRPEYRIESLEFSDGLHHGRVFEFCERTNAVIGPPNSGKSLLVDGLKFVFSATSDLTEVEETSKSRMAACLPEGTVVTARTQTPEGPRSISRTVGGAEVPTPPFRPIIFSQTELTRRAHASQPSIQLLDIHVDGLDELRSHLANQQAEVVKSFALAAENAQTASLLAEKVGNTEDGLAATKRRLAKLAGTEEVARVATASSRVDRWRKKVGEEIKAWADEPEIASLVIPPIPEGVEGDDQLAEHAPRAQLMKVVEEFEGKASDLIDEFARSLAEVLERGQSDFDSLSAESQARLKESGFEQGSELETELKKVRDRIHELEDLDGRRQKTETELDSLLVELRAQIEEASRLRSKITDLRKEACRRVNSSMRTFFAVVTGGSAGDLDDLIDDLKTGTYMRPEAREALREELDRPGLLEHAVRFIQGRTTTEPASDQERLAEHAVERERLTDLAKLAVTWQDDGLDLRRKNLPGADPTAFHELTEGLRALAIKEISFADSALPVISDQPEDAVPTKAVFESLVPTLRAQRSGRQFVVVSHDANIVVASDMENITALQGEEDGSPYTANLFDPQIRSLAMEHLEGGADAFDRRALLYGRQVGV